MAVSSGTTMGMLMRRTEVSFSWVCVQHSSPNSPVVFKRWSEHQTPPPTPGHENDYGLEDEQQAPNMGTALPVSNIFGHARKSSLDDQQHVPSDETNTLPSHLQDLKVLGDWTAKGVPSDHKLYEGLGEAEQSRVRGRLEGLHIVAEVAVKNESLVKAHQRAGVGFPDAIWKASPFGSGGPVGVDAIQGRQFSGSFEGCRANAIIEQVGEAVETDIRGEDAEAKKPESPKSRSTEGQYYTLGKVDGHQADMVTDQGIGTNLVDGKATMAVLAKSPFSWISDDDLSDPPSNLNTPFPQVCI